LTVTSLAVREELRVGGVEGSDDSGCDEEVWTGVQSSSASLVSAEVTSSRGAVLPPPDRLSACAAAKSPVHCMQAVQKGRISGFRARVVPVQD